MRGLLATIAVVLAEFAVLAALPAGPVPAGVLALLAAAVMVALWQQYRRSAREREAAVHRERLRLARDMHDRIGRRLGLAALQAAALEVRETDPARRREARQAGDTVRAAVEDLHRLVAVLRGDETAETPLFDPAAAASLASQFVESGVAVELRQSGAPGPIPAAGARAAYAVLEEGMANAAKHAPGRPITATVTWEDDALLVAVENEVAAGPPPAAASGGHGLAGLRERVDAAGGLLDHRVEDGRFRLSAMLPGEAPRTLARLPRPVRAAAFATVVVLLAILPLTTVAGVRG